jgi:acetyltransferase-like isoleucine patch superfamily enzyme
MTTWQKIKLVKQVAILKTVYYSLKFKGLIIIGRRTKLKLARGAKIEIKKGRLFIGVLFYMPQVTYLEIAENGTLSINGDVKFMKGCKIVIKKNAVLAMRGNAFINERCKIRCYKKISIGNNCLVSWDVNIVDTDAHHVRINGKYPENTKEVIINDNVWVGFNAMVLKGVSIGKGSMIGAGSVVTKNVPEYCLSAGNPSEVKRRNVTWQI